MPAIVCLLLAPFRRRVPGVSSAFAALRWHARGPGGRIARRTLGGARGRRA
jgi:hypothetical protein